MNAWHRIEASTSPNGSVDVFVSTNDDRDLGYPNDYAEWRETFASVDDFRRRHGVSRIGVSGVQVTVVLDGEVLL